MIQIDNITKVFQDPKTEVLDRINLHIKEGEFISIFGPNGCGKTTLLYIIAGVVAPTQGSVLINDSHPRKSDVGFIFQNYSEALFPWRSVIKNVEFGMETRDIDKKKRRKIAESLLKKTNLFKYKDRYIYQLSGGMKQLTAICRALAYNPGVLLLDEPFSSLDYSIARKMEMELLRIWEETKKTTILVSHNADEAVLLADKVIVLSERPARIKGIVDVELPRPRNLDMLFSREFFETRNKVLRLFGR